MGDTLPVKALVLPPFEKNPELAGYQRLYFGAEFCSWAMPKMVDILRARDLARAQKLEFTLMTPVLREATLAELATLFKALARDWQEQDELLISDFGTLEPAAAELPGARLVLGRALSGQKRGPRIDALQLPSEAAACFQQGSWYSSAARQVLRAEEIYRIELDNLVQGLSPVPTGLHGSLHLPWLLVTSSRNCPYHPDKSGRRCHVACGEPFRLMTPQTTRDLLQAGNSQFIENRHLPGDLAALGIDRLVEHRSLPR